MHTGKYKLYSVGLLLIAIATYISGIAFDPSGNLYVSIKEKGNVLKFPLIKN